MNPSAPFLLSPEAGAPAPLPPPVAGAYLQLLTQHLHEGLLLVDAGGAVVLLNERFCALAGLQAPPDAWRGTPATRIADHFAAQALDPAAFHATVRQVLEGGKGVLQDEVRLRDGRMLRRDVHAMRDQDTAAGFLLCYRDVTGQHQAQQQLQFVASIPEQNPQPVLRLAPDLTVLYANPAARQMQQALMGVGGEQARSQVQEMVAAALQDGQSRQQQLAIGLEWYQLTAVPIPAEGYVTLYLLDVTQARASQQALAVQQAFIQQVLDTDPSLVYVRDPAGRFTFRNKATRELLGQWRRPDHLGPVSRAAEQQQQWSVADTTVLATGQALTVEDQVTLATGEVRYYHTTKLPLPLPDGTRHVLGVSTDITALKHAQAELVRREKQYRDLMHYAQALIGTCDLRGIALTVNPALARLLNEDLADMPGKSVAEHLPPEDRDLFPAYLARIAAAGEDEGVVRVQPRGSQELRYLLYHNFVVREPGQAPYILSHAHDITERMRAEAELTRAKEAAESAVQAREIFLASVSHEIRTPLNGVLGMAGHLAKTHLDARQREFLDVIQRSGQHLLTVLNDVLDMAKIGSGKLELEQLPFNVCDAMGQALQPLAQLAADQGLIFEGTPLRQTCPHPWVVGDAHRLNQVLLNLVSNAIKFTPAGGTVRVAAQLEQETADTLTVAFRVSDTGIGIAPDRLAHIFEAFRQADTGTTRQYGGTGLGLSISQALLRQYGSELTVQSQVGHGSTFAFVLTLPKAPPAPSRPVPARYDTGRLRGRRVLLAEDNDISRVVARLHLEEWGCLVAEAEHGPGALARASVEPYDLVILDIQMPGLDGVAVCEAIRALSDRRQAAVPLLALTANTFQGDLQRYRAAGFDACLPKPFQEVEFYHQLVALLPAPVGELPLYNLAPLREVARGKEEFVRKMVASFRQKTPGSLTQLRAAADAEDWAAVARIAHHLKPNLAALAIGAAEEPLRVLEPLRQLPPAELQARAAALQAAVASLAQVVEQVLAALTAPGVSTPSETPDQVAPCSAPA